MPEEVKLKGLCENTRDPLNGENPAGAIRSYRPDIDGLRAISVLMVVFFHAGVGFPGGFLGVDVFFVISGYLITLIILNDIKGGQFSLGRFWLRRLRRIIPASLLTLVSVLITGYWLLLPADLLELCSSLRASLLFSANVFFWRNTGYFDGDVDLKPLLHFWSLAVEEQFYLFYPLFLMWIPPVSRRGRFVFSLVLGISLLVGFYGHLRYPGAAFFLLPCRAWELMLGGAICLLPERLFRISRFWKIAGVVGLLAIVLCGFIPRLSWARWCPPALVPCLGAVGVILSGSVQGGLSARILSIRPLVSVGVVSFSVYLWHWPILSFLRHLEVDLQFDVGGVTYRIACVVLSLLLGFGCYRLVEEPFRRRRLISQDRRYVLAVLFLILGCLFFAQLTIFGEGFPGRFSEQVLRYASAADDYSGRFVRSMSAADVRAGNLYSCGPVESGKRWLLLGDSHAICLLPGIAPLAEAGGVRIDQATRFSTAPLPGFNHLAIWQNDGGEAFVDAAMEVAVSESYDCVVLAAAWEAYVDWPTFDDSLERCLGQLLRAGKFVIFVLPVPQQKGNVPMMLSGRIRTGLGVEGVGVSVSEHESKLVGLRKVLERMDGPGLTVLDPVAALVGQDGLIHAEMGGESLYCDFSHLSHAGSQRVAGLLFRCMSEALKP